jgi:hypothetical protein
MTAAYLSNITRSDGDPKVLRTGPSSFGTADTLARVLGWFSIGLGIAEIVAPQQLTRMLGMEGKETLVRTYGAREIGTGLMCLSLDKQAGLWGRVGGDAVDVATLTQAYNKENPKRGNVGLALAAVAGVALLDLAAAQAVTRRHRNGYASNKGNGQPRLYSDRSGYPKGIAASRGIAPATAPAPR